MTFADHKNADKISQRESTRPSLDKKKRTTQSQFLIQKLSENKRSRILPKLNTVHEQLK